MKLAARNTLRNIP